MIGHFPIYVKVTDYPSTTATLNNPLGIDYDSSRNIIGIANFGSGVVTFIDGTTFNQITTVMPSGTINIAALKFDSVGDQWLVTDDQDALFYLIKASDYSVTTKAFDHTNGTIRGIDIDYVNDKIFVSSFQIGVDTTGASARIYVYKYSDFSAITNFSAPYSSGLHIDQPNNKLYVACHSLGNVKIYDATTYSLLTTITGTGDYALTLAYSISKTSNSNVLVVQDFSANKIVYLNKTTNTLYAKIGGVTSPRFSVQIGSILYVTSSLNKIITIDNI